MLDSLETRAHLGNGGDPSPGHGQASRFLPAAQIAQCVSYRDACWIAWQSRSNPNLHKRSLAELCGLYAPHVTDYFHMSSTDAKGSKRRDLPAEKIADVERVLGNRAISQYLARRGLLTLMEEVIAARTHG